MSNLYRDNTIYIHEVDRDFLGMRWEGFVRCSGRDVWVEAETRGDVIRAAGLVLWAINKFGPHQYDRFGPLHKIPGAPFTTKYPVIQD